MLGTIYSLAFSNGWIFRTVTANQWKMKYRFDLESLYQRANVEKHRVDAALIGEYHLRGLEDFAATKKWLNRL